MPNISPEFMAEKKARADAEKTAAFQLFMAKREIKLLASIIPPATPPETLESLLYLAFESGSDFGAMQLGTVFIDAMLKSDRPPRDRQL